METHFKANSNIYLIINNGARVSKDKYNDFAMYISQKNINVLTYNYTDVGASINSLKKSKTGIKDWANSDFKKIITHITSINKKAKIFVLGHSLGGQIIGLSDDYHKIQGIVLIATQSGYWKHWSFPLNILNYLTWNFYIPIILKKYNFLPKGKDKNLTDMPKKAALEWMSWCQSKNYLFDYIPKSERYYHKITCPLLSISFNNDIYATKEAVNWFTSQYINAKIIRKHYTSKVTKFSHSAAFEPSNFEIIGNDIINFIKQSYEQTIN